LSTELSKRTQDSKVLQAENAAKAAEMSLKIQNLNLQQSKLLFNAFEEGFIQQLSTPEGRSAIQQSLLSKAGIKTPEEIQSTNDAIFVQASRNAKSRRIAENRETFEAIDSQVNKFLSENKDATGDDLDKFLREVAKEEQLPFSDVKTFVTTAIGVRSNIEKSLTTLREARGAARQSIRTKIKQKEFNFLRNDFLVAARSTIPDVKNSAIDRINQFILSKGITDRVVDLEITSAGLIIQTQDNKGNSLPTRTLESFFPGDSRMIKLARDLRGTGGLNEADTSNLNIQRSQIIRLTESLKGAKGENKARIQGQIQTANREIKTIFDKITKTRLDEKRSTFKDFQNFSNELVPGSEKNLNEVIKDFGFGDASLASSGRLAVDIITKLVANEDGTFKFEGDQALVSIEEIAKLADGDKKFLKPLRRFFTSRAGERDTLIRASQAGEIALKYMVSKIASLDQDNSVDQFRDSIKDSKNLTRVQKLKITTLLDIAVRNRSAVRRGDRRTVLDLGLQGIDLPVRQF